MINNLPLSSEDIANSTLEHYEGVEGIKKIYLDTLTAKSHLLSTLQPSAVEKTLYEWLTTDYVQERVKRNISAYVLVSTNIHDKALQDYIDNADKEKRIVHVVDPMDKPFEVEMVIYDDKVAFMQYNPAYPLGAVLIKNKAIADTMRALYLHYLWRL
jgi:hypothetical protein